MSMKKLRLFIYALHQPLSLSYRLHWRLMVIAFVLTMTKEIIGDSKK